MIDYRVCWVRLTPQAPDKIQDDWFQKILPSLRDGEDAPMAIARAAGSTTAKTGMMCMAPFCATLSRPRGATRHIPSPTKRARSGTPAMCVPMR
jgi:hypothetical protein